MMMHFTSTHFAFTAPALRRVRRLAGLLIGITALACHDGGTAPPSVDEHFWALDLNVHAVNLSTVAPYDTIQLVTVARDGTGAAIPDGVRVTFRSSDSTTIVVDSTGRVTAVQPTSGSPVVITVNVTSRGTTRRDTVFVQAENVAPPPRPAQLQLALPPGTPPIIPTRGADYLKNFLFLHSRSVVLTTQVTDSSGADVSGLFVDYRSSDPRIATVDSIGRVTATKPGPVTIFATTSAYGVVVRDSLELTFIPSRLAGFEILSKTPVNSTTPVAYFSPGPLTVSAGATVFWINRSGLSVDVTFDDSTAVTAVPDSVNTLALFGFPSGASGGNIPALPVSDATSFFNAPFETRYFPTPGTYTFRSKLYPAAVDTLIVVP